MHDETTTRNAGDDMIRRFSPWRVAEHLVLIAAFTALVTTGLSQRFYDAEFSQWLVLWLGGIDQVRLIHRLFGTAFVVLLAVHVATAVAGVALRGWQPSMLVTQKDLADTVNNIRYYIGLLDKPVLCDRYDYKEKFVYWLVLTGGVIMATTGLALWFPVLAVRHLPGELIPVAKALHSNEALLIFLLITVWHIYDSIFSPDVFPLDKSIFTGYISRQRMLRQHPLELARLEGKAEAAAEPEPVPAGDEKPTKAAP